MAFYLEEDGKIAQIDAIEFVKPPASTAAESYLAEVEKRNKLHWSYQLALVSGRHMQTVTHKFETWK